MDVAELTTLYRNRFSDREIHFKNEMWRIICANYLSRFIRKSDTVIDVACGFGEFLNHIEAARKVGIDLNADARNYLADDVQLVLCNATSMSERVKIQADVVFTSNFLEHLSDKRALEAVLDEVLKLLRPGGRFLALGPNLRYLPGKYWDYYDHHLGLTHLSLVEVLMLKGFVIEHCLDRFLPYTTKGALPNRPWLVSLYLRLPFVWRLLGKQFFVVARKPTDGER